MSKGFQFKQFYVAHDLCAMKVGTDGVLLGTWVEATNNESVLDVGCGSGLVSLILAQRFSTITIKAIDIEKSAWIQTQQNFEASPWSDRLNVEHVDYCGFSNFSFDHIVSNPPYFSSSYLSANKSRDRARHDVSLSFINLLEQSIHLLHVGGKLSVVIPYLAEEEFLALALNIGFTLSRRTRVKSREAKKPERSLLELNKNGSEKIVQDTELILLSGSGRHDYTSEYREMIKDFYTIL